MEYYDYEAFDEAEVFWCHVGDSGGAGVGKVAMGNEKEDILSFVKEK